MADRQIRDIPSIKKVVDDVRNMRQFQRVVPLLGPLLAILGVDTAGLKDAMAAFPELEREVCELAAVPDRFNELFAQRGWIIYDAMSMDAAKAAIERAEEGDIVGAEARLVAYYDDDTVRWQLQRMIAVEAFRPRMHLAEKALDDYCNERYHACVPVVLALLDGMVNDIHEKRRGFFAEGANLDAWDSIAAHDTGLNTLAALMRTGRYKTTTEEITVPYRNGILHGMDLSYDNRITAAKSWAALFATRDWAQKAEQGLLVAPPEEPESTLLDLFRQLRENELERRHLDTWVARSMQPGVDVPVSGGPGTYEDGTPEQKLAEFLTYWKTGNYGYMARCLSPQIWGATAKLPGRLRERYKDYRLLSFELAHIEDEAPAITEIETKIVYEFHGNKGEASIRFRMIYECPGGKVAARGKPSGSWFMVTWPCL